MYIRGPLQQGGRGVLVTCSVLGGGGVFHIKGCGIENQTITTQSIDSGLGKSENVLDLAHREGISRNVVL